MTRKNIDTQAEYDRLKRKLARETKAREEAERLLEEKAEELFIAATQARNLAQAIESAADGIALTDADGKFVYMNESHAKMFDYEIEDLIGKPWATLYAETELERFNSEIMPVFQDKGVWAGETIGYSKDGLSVYQDITLTALEAGGLICATKDVSERRERENIIRDMERRLQGADRDAAIAVFGRAIAHDLNNLIAAISGYALLLETDLEEESGAKHRATRISKAAEQAASIVASLDQFQSGNVLMERIDLSQLVKTNALVAEGFRPNDIRLVVNITPDLIVNTNEVALSRCVVNCLKNAFEAIPQNGMVALNVSEATDALTQYDHTISLGMEQDHYAAIIEIIDTGVGMNDTTLKAAFAQDFSTKDALGIRGLGLQSVKRMAELDLAYIQVETTQGRGTRFCIKLKSPTSFTEDLRPDVTPHATPKVTGTIMILDDDPLVGDMLEQTLKRMGYDAFWYEFPDIAMTHIQAFAPDLLITDYNMPDMNGDEVARQAKDKYEGLPVIVLSGQAAAIPNNPNFDVVLKKPINPETLNDVIRSILT